jgi:hypothetical protein
MASGLFLALALLEFRVLLVDDVDLTLAAYDLAISGAFLYGSSDFHDTLFFKF